MAQEKKIKKPKKIEREFPKGLEPTKSILENKILRILAFSIIGAISVILILKMILFVG